MNIQIRPLEVHDAKESWFLRGNDLLWKYMQCDSPYPPTLETELEYNENVISRDDIVVFSIFDKDVYLGYIALKCINDGCCELSYCIMRTDYWGKGVLSNATRQVLKYAFYVRDLDLVVVFVNPDNVASWKNVRNKGFFVVGDSYIAENVKRLELTRTKWKRLNQKSE